MTVILYRLYCYTIYATVSLNILKSTSKKVTIIKYCNIFHHVDIVTIKTFGTYLDKKA